MDYKFLLSGQNHNCICSAVLIIQGLNFQHGDYPDFFSDALSSLKLPDVNHFPNHWHLCEWQGRAYLSSKIQLLNSIL